LKFRESPVSGFANEVTLVSLRPLFLYFGSWLCAAQLALFLLECDQFMQIIVRDNNVDQALRALKKKLQREGVYREMKLRRHYEKPSEKRAREKAAAVRRARKMDRKRMERDGAK
jgi:small subunit ribosomal protein S21